MMSAADRENLAGNPDLPARADDVFNGHYRRLTIAHSALSLSMVANKSSGFVQ